MSFTRGFKQAGGFRPNNELVDVPSRHTREGWTEVTTHTSVMLHGKQYRNMKEWSRPCIVCDAKFSAFESSNRSDANSQFSNKTCTPHRGLLPALEKGFIAWSKDLGGMVPGHSCVSRDVPTAPAGEEVAALRSWKATVTEELKSLDELRRDHTRLFQENSVLKARLAKYELAPAMEAVKNKFPWGS